MIVIDASAFVEFLSPQQRTELIDSELEADPHWLVPEHFTIEVAHALRSRWLRHEIGDGELDAALAALGRANLDVWPTAPLLPRVRELMPNASAYDAAYVALAEELAAPLLTVDARLTTVPGARCAFVGI